MLKLKQVSLGYNGTKVVKNISFTLNKNERLVIVGASGCGKTTLLKAISGFHNIDEGEITLHDIKIKDPSKQLVPGHPQIKLINQDFNLDDYHTVEENIRLRLLQYDNDYQNVRVEELLKLIELNPQRNHKAIDLSGGQKQRLAIARALADEPDLLLLDEPFNQLDFHLKHKIENYILNYLNRYKISAILVSHNGEEAMRWADRVAFMKKGKFVRQDKPKAFYNQPQNKYEANFFGKLNTILIDRKEFSFRPHHFSLEKKKNYVKLNTELKGKLELGWYTEYLFKYGKRKFSIFATEKLDDVKTLWVKPVSFK
ncbi:MAG: ABC transporter ATP-binding protein [Putridiphycobacter sp.]